jgi:RNA polymerase sigma factor (sigma-70 family)
MPAEPASRALIEQALVALRQELTGFLGRNASATLLRFETAEDLYQGFASQALARSERFQDRGEGSASAWLHELGRNYLRDRHRHWSALKRGSGNVLRSGLGAPISTAGPRSHGFGGEPTAGQAGPASIAARREELVLAAKALALLLPRDRLLVEWSAEEVPVHEMAQRIGLTPDAASKARSRALERLRKTHELVLRRALDGGR